MNRMNFNMVVATLALAAIGVAPLAQAQDKSSFDASVQKLEPKMSRNMKHAPVNGNPDHDFMTKMMPHHQGAIDMAWLELKYGKDPKIRQMARKMIDDQQKDIARMKKQLHRMEG